MDLYIRCLPLHTSERLVDHNLCVGKRKSLALCTARKKECAHGCRHTDTDSGNIAFDVVHSVVDRHSCRDRASGAVDVKINILVGILRLEIEELCNNERCGNIVYLIRKENDSVIKKSGINVIGALTA